MMEDYYGLDDWYRPYLSPGEYVRWAGRPESKAGFQLLYLFVIPFMLFWFGGVLFATVGSVETLLETGDGLFEVLFMLPFWVGGIAVICMVFVVPRLRLKNTKYVVTNQKAMACYRGRITAVNLDPTPYVCLSSIDKRGCGSITIGGPAVGMGQGMYSSTAYTESQSGFTIANIKDAAKVYELIVHPDPIL